jgi:hypothetical protein
MKEKELQVDFKEQQLILYAEKDDKTYGAMQTGSYVSKHFLDDYLLKKENLEKELRAEVVKGNVSSVYYFMVLLDMGPGDLARRVGIGQRKLRKHFKPEVFAKLDEAMLEKYAVVFAVTADELKSIGRRAKF